MVLYSITSQVFLFIGTLSASQFDPLKHLAGTSPPYDYDASTSPLDPIPPEGCNVTRASYLVRHAAIHSNHYEFRNFIEPFLNKLNSTPVNWSTIPNLSFISKWKNPILSEEQAMVSRSGKLQAMTLGVELAQRYYDFRPPKKIWSASSERTMKSAQYFTKGLAANPNNVTVLSSFEGKHEGANSLTPYESCSNYSKSAGNGMSAEFLKIYTRPAITRLNNLAPGFNFTSSDIYAMSLICGYETVLRGSSPFCNLSVLSANEWLGFEYTNDINYFYTNGYGSSIAGAVGFPWVNASFNALMSKHDTQSDKTVDQDLFVSFTHRQLPPMVIVAMGLFNNSAYSGANNVLNTMPLNQINFQRVWKSSQIIPFMTDIGIEKLECDSFGFDKGTYYRILVNDNPQSLHDCRDGPAETCKESTVKQWLAERYKIVGDFNTACQVNYPNSTNILSLYNN